MTGYPPQPWDLRGRMYLSLWLLPRSALPAPQPGLADRARPVLIGGRALVAGAWVHYAPGGVLTYRELLVATLVRDGRRPRVTITHIWVDSAASLEGGRRLWGIPKELADLAVGEPDHAGHLACRAAWPEAPLAEADLRPGARLPGRWPAAFTVIQRRDGDTLVTPVRASFRVGAARSGWRVAGGGPLGYLAGRRPVLTLALTDFRLRFGR